MGIPSRSSEEALRAGIVADRVPCTVAPLGRMVRATMSSSPAFRALSTTSPRGFRLQGEIDLSNAGALSDLLKPEVEAGGDLTIDLSGVAFMDSSAIQVLLKAGRLIEGKGRILLYHPGSLVSNVLKLIKADRLPGIEIQEGPE